MHSTSEELCKRNLIEIVRWPRPLNHMDGQNKIGISEELLTQMDVVSNDLCHKVVILWKINPFYIFIKAPHQMMDPLNG